MWFRFNWSKCNFQNSDRLRQNRKYPAEPNIPCWDKKTVQSCISKRGIEKLFLENFKISPENWISSLIKFVIFEEKNFFDNFGVNSAVIRKNIILCNPTYNSCSLILFWTFYVTLFSSKIDLIFRQKYDMTKISFLGENVIFGRKHYFYFWTVKVRIVVFRAPRTKSTSQTS